MPKMLDLIRLVQRGELPPPPVAALIGFTVGSIEAGRVVMEMDAGPPHASPMSTVHGGILRDLADAAMGMAYAHGDKDRLVARASSTGMTLRGARGEERRP